MTDLVDEEAYWNEIAIGVEGEQSTVNKVLWMAI